MWWNSKRNNWDINIEKVAYNEELPQGLVINVSNLYDEIARNFSKNIFINNLIEEIQVRYRYKLQAGFNIIVNGIPVKPLLIDGDKVAESPYKIINGMNIKIVLYNNVSTKANGWDIIVNGRVVVQRDKTEKTLWKKKLITKGCSYEKFVGEVLIKGDNIKKLPIWSTKDGIDTKIIAPAETEIKNIDIKTNYTDYLFYTDDGGYLHFEFQTTNKRDDLKRSRRTLWSKVVRVN